MAPSSPGRFAIYAPALVSGLVFIASIPPFDHYLFAWICLLPLFLARQWVPSQRHFALGLAAGLGGHFTCHQSFD